MLNIHEITLLHWKLYHFNGKNEAFNICVYYSETHEMLIKKNTPSMHSIRKKISKFQNGLVLTMRNLNRNILCMLWKRWISLAVSIKSDVLNENITRRTIWFFSGQYYRSILELFSVQFLVDVYRKISEFRNEILEKVEKVTRSVNRSDVLKHLISFLNKSEAQQPGDAVQDRKPFEWTRRGDKAIIHQQPVFQLLSAKAKWAISPVQTEPNLIMINRSQQVRRTTIQLQEMNLFVVALYRSLFDFFLPLFIICYANAEMKTECNGVNKYVMVWTNMYMCTCK